MDSTSDLIATGALIVSIVTFVFSLHINRREQEKQGRINLTVSLYTEFQKEETLRSRIRADKLLAANLLAAEQLSLSKLYSSLDESEWYHISRVLHFFQQLEVYREAKYLDSNLAKVLFGPYFRYFYDRYFSELFSSEEDWLSTSYPLIQKVNEWMN